MSNYFTRFSVLVYCLTTTTVYAEQRAQSLLEIYHQALAHDPTLASALDAHQASQEIIQQSKALFRPTVNFTASSSASRYDIAYYSSNVPFKNGSQSFEGYQYGVEARQPLYRRQTQVDSEQAETQVSLADKQLYLSQQTLISRTTNAYFDVLLTQDKLHLLQVQKTATAQQLEQAKANFDAGTITITDVNETQARYDLILAQEIAAISQLQIAQHAVQAIIGDMPANLASVRADLKTNRLEQSMDTWLTVAADNDLNIQIRQDNITLAEQEIERAKAGHLPTLDAVASYSDNYANGGYYGFGSDLKIGTIGVQLQVPLYQGGAVSSRIAQAQSNKQKAQDELEIARRQMQLNTQSAYLNLNSSIAQVKAYEQALISSQSQLDSSKEGYNVGIRTQVDVLNAQQLFFSAQRDLLQARYSYLVNIIHLKAVAGIVSEADLQDINQQLVW